MEIVMGSDPCGPLCNQVWGKKDQSETKPEQKINNGEKIGGAPSK